jgi:hypothetical protein
MEMIDCEEISLASLMLQPVRIEGEIVNAGFVKTHIFPVRLGRHTLHAAPHTVQMSLGLFQKQLQEGAKQSMIFQDTDQGPFQLNKKGQQESKIERREISIKEKQEGASRKAKS